MIERAQFRSARNYALAIGAEFFRPLLRATARILNSNAIDPSLWRRGLLLGASHIGDVLYRSASLAALKRGLPACSWNYLAEPASAGILRNNPNLAGVIEGAIQRPGSAAFFNLARRLRAERFDAAICYDTGSYWPSLLLATLAGIPNRVGYVHKGFSGLVTRPVAIRSPQPFPAYFRDLVSELTGLPPDWPLTPAVATTVADETEAMELWRELALDETTPVLACFVTTRQPSGVWPRASYGEVLRLIADRHRVQIVLCGAPGDAAILAELRQQFRLDCRIAAGRLGLRPLVGFLRRCTAVLSTDSGPRHLANAAGRPVFFVRNLWFNKVEAGSYCATDVDLAPDVELSGPREEEAVFRLLTPESVARIVMERLQLLPR